MLGQPATITLRNDEEIMRALESLGVTEGSRSAVVKAAILAYAATQRSAGESQAALHRIKAELAEIDRKLAVLLGVAA